MKSVDALKTPVNQDNSEFQSPLAQPVQSKNRKTERAKGYQSPRVYSLNPGNFLRRNLSEQKEQNEIFKRSARKLYTKPLSLVSSMKKFEVDPDDIIDKPKAARNLMKCECNYLYKEKTGNIIFSTAKSTIFMIRVAVGIFEGIRGTFTTRPSLTYFISVAW